MIDITIPVPDNRLADFYATYSSWLAREDSVLLEPSATTSALRSVDWSDDPEDLVLGRAVWNKLSEHATNFLGTLMESPEEKFSGEYLADLHGIPNGKYGAAGVLAWPKRHSKAVGRGMPCRYEDGPVGASANYWMTAEAASLFRKARDGE